MNKKKVHINQWAVLLTAALFAALGLAPTASAAGPGASLELQGPHLCRTYENDQQYSESCEFKVLDDDSVCVGYYYHRWKTTGETTERCDHHVKALPMDGQVAAAPGLQLFAGPGVCSWEKTNQYEKTSCVVLVGNNSVCYNYYYYHRYSDGTTTERCEREVALDDGPSP